MKDLQFEIEYASKAIWPAYEPSNLVVESFGRCIVHSVEGPIGDEVLLLFVQKMASEYPDPLCSQSRSGVSGSCIPCVSSFETRELRKAI